MQRAIDAYLQRYLLKILIKRIHCTKYEKQAIQQNLNLHSPNLKKKTFNFDKQKKNVFRPCVHVYKKRLVKGSKRQGNLNFNPLNKINSSYFICLKTFTFSNKSENLGNGNLILQLNTFQVLTFQIKISSVMSITENIPFYSYNQKDLFILIGHDFLNSVEIENLKSLKSFSNLCVFIYGQLILNNKQQMVHSIKLFYITFTTLSSLVYNRTSNNEPFLPHKIVIFLNNFFFSGLKYVKQKKLSQSTEYKVFNNLFIIFSVYKKGKKILNPFTFKPFYKNTVYLDNSISFYFFLMRPLFSVTRNDTFYICESLKLPIYPDQSNYKVDFLRNRVRKQLLPSIRILLNPQFDTILCKFNESYL